ncbi:hypothetical protein CYL20_20795 [Pseudomonas palleroniana]|uniref:Uncharacterized protein n=1 Tax=Pseudomonas palleroniana TaxID=191390 RepID=A0A2L1JEI5_9PSED|nr:hypothetical protein CYL20_20795 [Pseudomonas palleroniana]
MASPGKSWVIFRASLIVPTLRVGIHPVTLCVTTLRADAERPGLHFHTERGNDRGITCDENFQTSLCRHVRPHRR